MLKKLNNLKKKLNNLKKKDMKITKRSVCKFTTVLVEGIEIGQIKLNVEVQVISHGDDSNSDIEVLDYEDITYMGLKVDDANELFKFHRTLGIDLDYEINKKVKATFNEKVMNDIVYSTARAITYN